MNLIKFLFIDIVLIGIIYLCGVRAIRLQVVIITMRSWWLRLFWLDISVADHYNHFQ